MRKRSKVFRYLRVIQIVFVIVCIINILVPVYTNNEAGYKSIFQILIIVFYALSVAGVNGLMGSVIYPAPTALIRGTQVFTRLFLFKKTALNMPVFVILILIDVAFYALLIRFRSRFKFIEGEARNVKKRRQ